MVESDYAAKSAAKSYSTILSITKILTTQKGENPMKTTCPECEAEITLAANAEVNEIIVCPDCGVDLEVISLNPAKLELAPMEEEDWGE
jgi:alpha-aminoadipate/glutamate carrier protein LysW